MKTLFIISFSWHFFRKYFYLNEIELLKKAFLVFNYYANIILVIFYINSCFPINLNNFYIFKPVF